MSATEMTTDQPNQLAAKPIGGRPALCPGCPGEEWRDVAGWQGLYEVSSCGRVRSLDRASTGRYGTPLIRRGQIRRLQNVGGYFHVALRHKNERSEYLAHRLVLIAFAGQPEDGQEVAHFDGVGTNNHVANLRWASPKENHADAVRHGTKGGGEKHPCAKLTLREVEYIRTMYSMGFKQTDLAGMFGTHQTNISLIVNRRHWPEGN